MLKEFGDNVFQGCVIEVYIGMLFFDQVFIFMDWMVEMKVKVVICILQDSMLIELFEIVKSRIQIMIDKGMDNDKGVLRGLVERVD